MSVGGAPDRSRALDLTGLFNARDVGGLTVAGGGSIAFRRLYRAEVLTRPGGSGVHSEWLESDTANLTGLGVKTVIDLRSDQEAGLVPSAWAEATGAECTIALPIDDGGHGAAKDYVEMLISGQMTRFGSEDLGKHYISVLEARPETFGVAAATIAEAAPALVHCTEGKDRTGLVIAVVLSAVGARAEDIVDDYALTSLWRPDRAKAYAPHFEAAGLALESFRVLYESPAAAMEMALEHLDSAYGGAGGYLSRRGGLSDATIAALRDSLLQPGARVLSYS